ncbi:MAG: rRNA maturation RNase YbeY [Oscillospiraceae bacterium]|nr:rRNA maturation RNase YbeY [Oscillospiraceae bacterium]
MNHAVWVRAERPHTGGRSLTSLVKRCVRATLTMEKVPVLCEVNVLYMDEEGIRALNREHRGKDVPTDVLSFPLLTLTPGEMPEATDLPVDPDTGRLPLGDIALSLPAARAQAEEYGHTFDREVAFLIVHATLHLLGYDHEGGPKEEHTMREHAEAVLISLGLTRGVTP